MKLIDEKSELTTKIANLANAPNDIVYYTTHLKKMNENLGYVGTNEYAAQDIILEYLGAFTDTTDILLKEMPQTMIHEMNGYKVETNILRLQGDFSHLVKLMYMLEYTHKVSKITSANFHMDKDAFTKRHALFLEIHLQNIVI